MSMSREEASAALATVEQVDHRVGVLSGYRDSAGHFFLWGVIWIVGYGLTGVRPEYVDATWLLLDAAGFVGSYLIGRAVARRRGQSSAHYRARYAGGIATFLGLYFAILYVFPPREMDQVAALPALLIAAAYLVTGLFRGTRWVVAGMVLGTMTVAGFALLPANFMLWMAAVGGGTLLTTGFWLRRG